MNDAYKQNQKPVFGTIRNARQNKIQTLNNIKDEHGEVIKAIERNSDVNNL